MTEKEYRQHPSVSRSELFALSKSPEKFKYRQENPEPPTPALIFGQLFHAMALQPDALNEEFAVAPNVDRRTKAGKEAFAEFEQVAQDKIVVTTDMFTQATAMREALQKNEFVKKLLQGNKEVPFFWNDDLTGEPCKCRVDCLTDLGEELVIIDLKTADDAETDAFTKSAVKYGYDFQSAMYTEGVKANHPTRKIIFVFIVIEKKPPYAINILQSDKLFVQRGYDLFREYIGIYHECKRTNNWYGYLGALNEINNLALPAYLAREVE